MKLNTDRLVIRDVFSYDIEACHYNLLSKFGYNMSNIDQHNKLKRNIQIGKIMRDDKTTKSRLRETTKQIIDDYIEFNELLEEDIIIRQYDGLITKKRLLETNKSILPIALQNRYDLVLISIDRNKYIAFDNLKKKVKIKGVPNLYKGIETYYKRLIRIVDIENKTRVLDNLQKLKSDFSNEKDINIFAIPTDNEEEVEIIFKSFGQIKIKRNTLYYMIDDEIDKNFYYDFYLHSFIQSIVLETLS
jgi:hypothetical protein